MKVRMAKRFSEISVDTGFSKTRNLEPETVNGYQKRGASLPHKRLTYIIHHCADILLG